MSFGRRIRATCWIAVFIVLACPMFITSVSVVSAQDATEGNGKYLNFSFDQVEVRNFVKLVGEITGHRFIIDSKVAGNVTVVYPKIPADEVFPVFVSILESVGCSVDEVKTGVYRVVSLAPRTSKSGPIIGPNEKTPERGLITKIIRIEHVNAAELVKILEPKIAGGKEGAIGSIDSTNHIILTDTAENIRRIEKLIAEVDKPGLARSSDVVSLKYASAEELADQLTRAIGGTSQSSVRRSVARYGSAAAIAKQSGGQRAVVVAAPHSNSLILVGSQSQLTELKSIIAKMDIDSPSGSGRLSAVFLKYIAADEAAKSLNALMAKKGSGRTSTGGAPRLSGGNRGIAIEPHLANNALLIDAMPRDFELVRDLIEQIDLPPEQVLIEVLIVEISMRDQLDIGVNMIAIDMPSGAGQDVLSGASITKDSASSLLAAAQTGLFPGGLSLGVTHGNSVDSEGNVSVSYPGLLNIDAMRKDGSFDILSNIPLVTQNNKEATVSIVENIPIVKSTITGSGSGRDVIQNIDRIDVGIKLKLTPHINPGGEVLMALNPSIEMIIDPGTVADGMAPTIARREISTTVTVPDGETIVLSGLIQEDHTEAVRRIPILGSIPLLGWLFRHKISDKKKTNLLVFVTPHIVTDHAAARKMTEAWDKKTTLEAVSGKSSDAP